MIKRSFCTQIKITCLVGIHYKNTDIVIRKYFINGKVLEIARFDHEVPIVLKPHSSTIVLFP